MTKQKVVISEDLWWELPAWFRESYEVIYNPGLVQDVSRLNAQAKDAEALVVRNRTQVNEDLLKACPHLRVVGRLGVGLDNVDLAACTTKGISVIAAKGCNAVSVAEYVLSCLFHHARFLHSSDAAIRGNRWDRSISTGTEVFGKTLGLVGVGDIGQRVATRAVALGLRVIAYDPFVLPTSSLVQDVGVELTDLRSVLSFAHYLSIHVPLTKSTHHIIGKPELALLREDAMLINTSRGAVIDEQALLDSLKEAPQRYAYLDVRETEPPRMKDRLINLPNVVSTPHVAGITRESSERVAKFILSQVDAVLQGRAAQGLVN